jgi:RNA polymerase sigma-70 factor (ECF subfamily)
MRSQRTEPLTRERTLLRSARLGDEDAFGRLVEGQRAALHAHCYRMLGSARDAEDAVQETMVRAWRGLPRYQGRSSLRTWLRRIATNVCLDAMGWRPARDGPVDRNPGPVPGRDDHQTAVREPVRIELEPGEALAIADGAAAPEARYEQREALELALIVALRHLPGRQRAVLLLREALGFSAKEVSAMLGSSVASTNSALQRARRTLDERRGAPGEKATPRAPGDGRLREVVERFVEAFERGDVAAIVGLLSEDASLAAPCRSAPGPISAGHEGPRDPSARRDRRRVCRRAAPVPR